MISILDEDGANCVRNIVRDAEHMPRVDHAIHEEAQMRRGLQGTNISRSCPAVLPNVL